MKQVLEALEKKINKVIENSNKLRKENKGLIAQLKAVQEEKDQMEKTILKEHTSNDNLVKEKDSIKVAIESLLENISKLEISKE